MTLKKKTIIVKGKKIRYLLGGNGRPMLFIHGWSTNPLAHKASLKLLGRRFTVYAPFLFDFRISDLNGMAKGLAIFADKLKLRKTIVVGTSFGGILAAILAVMKPGKVRKLLLINTSGIPIKASAFTMFLDSLSSFAMLALQRKISVLLARWISGLKFQLQFWRKELRKLAVEVSQKDEIETVFRKVKVKTAVIWSDGDVTYPVSYAKKIKDAISNSMLVVVKGTHAWHYHSPELFAKTVEKAAHEKEE